MKPGLLLIVGLPLALLLFACSNDNNNSGADESKPIPEVNLEETGVYSGTLVTPDGAVALMSLLLARDGTTAITFETDDSERATRVLWGVSDGESGEITFEGRDTDSAESVFVDIQIEGDEATGTLALANLTGAYRLGLEAFSQRTSTLQKISGNYALNDNLAGLTELTIGTDGSVRLSGTCVAGGSVSLIDGEVNLYLLTLDSDCVELDVLVSLQDVEVEGDVISLSGDGGDMRFAVDFYRI